MADKDTGDSIRAAAIIRPPDNSRTDCLDAFIRILQGQGYIVRGLIQRNLDDDSGCGCTMLLVDLDSHREYRISQNLGRDSTCCRVDTNAIADASTVLRQAMTERPDLIIVNKFGKLEAGGEGLADEMLAIMAGGIPLLTTVEPQFLDGFRRFTGGMAAELSANCGSLMRWWDGARPRGLPRGATSPQDAFQRMAPIPEMS